MDIYRRLQSGAFFNLLRRIQQLVFNLEPTRSRGTITLPCFSLPAVLNLLRSLAFCSQLFQATVT